VLEGLRGGEDCRSGALHLLSFTQPAEITVEGTERKVPGLSSDLQHQAVRKPAVSFE